MGIKLRYPYKTFTDLKIQQSSGVCYRHWFTLHSRVFDLNKKTSCSFNEEVRQRRLLSNISELECKRIGVTLLKTSWDKDKILHNLSMDSLMFVTKRK